MSERTSTAEGRSPRVSDTDDALALDHTEDARDRRVDRRHRWAIHGGQVVSGIVILAAWQAAGHVWGAFVLSNPVLIVKRIAHLASSGDLWPNLQVTLIETFGGLVIGMLIGVALGVALASSRLVGRWVYPYIMALYSLPRVALAPLFIVWFGIGLESKIIMVVTMVVFVAFYNTYQGMRNIDSDLLYMARSLRANRWTTLRWVILPATAPWILTALRLSIALGLIGAVISELVGASKGLGYYMGYSANVLDTTGVFAGLVIVTVIAMLAEQLVALLERRLMRHH